MKNRMVKVAVYPVRHKTGNQNVHVPDLTLLKQRLNEIFAYQTNAWFDITIKNQAFFDYAGESGSGYPDGYSLTSHTPKEFEMLQNAAFADPAQDITVFLIDNINYYADGSLATGASYPPILGQATALFNKCVVNVGWTGEPFTRPDEDIVHTIAHEIGHLVTGIGHPDLGGGFAKLQHLTLADHRKRLMCSGENSTLASKLLVKTEWDKAEEWLKAYTDMRN